MDIRLPGQQKELAQAVVRQPPCTTAFLGGLVDIQGLSADIAIVRAWFPGATGGTAVAQTVFGEHNRFGKLPFMVHYKFYGSIQFDNLNMTDGPGRTYKYLKNPTVNSLWPFGYGLSYTNFSISQPTLSQPQLRLMDGTPASMGSQAVTASVTVKNTGDRAGDEVVMLFEIFGPC